MMVAFTRAAVAAIRDRAAELFFKTTSEADSDQSFRHDVET
jgi:hypothetical protein